MVDVGKRGRPVKVLGPWDRLPTVVDGTNITPKSVKVVKALSTIYSSKKDVSVDDLLEVEEEYFISKSKSSEKIGYISCQLSLVMFCNVINIII